jgi:15-cis-phytoene synthase
MEIPQGSLERKTSFFLPLLLLDPPRRAGLERLYRFCWAADDISDGEGSPSAKQRLLREFKRDLADCLKGRPRDAFWASFLETLRRFRMSSGPLWTILQGVERDLSHPRFKRFDELRSYAQQVAGGPGLAAMEIFGGRSPDHRRYAENLGVFLQLVNITRDFLEDRAMGRRYFPLEDFTRFGISEKDPVPGFAWSAFVRFQLNRAYGFWSEACRALPRRERCRFTTAEAIAAVYGVLFRKLKDHPERILQGRVALSGPEKIMATLGAAARCFCWRLKPPPNDCGC